MREKAIPEQHTERIAPLRVCRRCLAAYFSSIDNVVVHQRRDVDRFKNDCQLVVIVFNPAGSTTGKKSQCRTDPFPGGIENVGDVGLHRRIKGLGLGPDS